MLTTATITQRVCKARMLLLPTTNALSSTAAKLAAGLQVPVRSKSLEAQQRDIPLFMTFDSMLTYMRTV
jgi:hypothetical protein